MQVLTAAGAYLRSRWRSRSLRSRAAIAAHQARELARLNTHLRAHLPFYAELPNGPFDQLPILDKAVLLDNFAALNTAGATLASVKAALAGEIFTVDGLSVGHSTGTSGNRGYYVISERERFVWLGTILAKTLPDALWAKHRVALVLPGMSALYSAARTGSRIDIRFFDLAQGVAAWADALQAFAPDTIVAPPKVLRHLAEAGTLQAEHIFSGAEVLDLIDRQVIEECTGRTVRQIYMATEGLFGVSCRFGTLHLAEDVVHFEWEPVAGSDLVSPVVTDFTRRTQAMARYRMNDLLELSDMPCPCGSAFQAVARIEGRADDIFYLPDVAGTARMVTPDVLRNTLIDVDGRITDFRIVQTGAASVEVRLDENLASDLSPKVKQAFASLFQKQGLGEVELTVLPGINVPYDRKLRRVRRDWHP